MHIQITRSNPNRKFEDCDYYEFDNVTAVAYYNCENRAIIHLQEEIDKNIVQPHYKYFICDAPGSPAFAHWVHEFFYPSLPLLYHFKKDEDILFILFDEPKRYMVNFLRRIGIPNDRIVLASDDTNNHVSVSGVKSISLKNPNNTTIFPPLYSLNDGGISYDDWERQILRSTLLSLPESSNKYPFVLIKRSIKDNFYTFKDRPQIGIEKLEDWVIKAGGILMDGYLINNIHLQETIIRNANIIITNSGSSYLANGIIAKDSIILVIDDINCHTYVNNFPGVKAIDDFVTKYNTRHVFPNVDSTINMLESLHK